MLDTEIIAYLETEYHPLGMIVYGSFANGIQNAHSDFDALLITREGEKSHDSTIVHGTELDVFLYPASCFSETACWSDYEQIYDGIIVKDTDGIAAHVLQQVRAYLDGIPPKTNEENRVNVEWCEKMLLRSRRGDDEGFFRWHWLLTDSLEIYFDVIGKRYWGPKKSLRSFKQEDPVGAALYSQALHTLSQDALEAWIAYLRGVFDASVK